MNGVAIFLCDLTGIAAEPWIAAGYRVVLVDPQHPAGIHTDGQVTRIGGVILDAAAYIGDLMRRERIVFVAGFPPCTDVAVSGARWFSLKAAKDRFFQAKAALVAEQCRMIGMLAGCPWIFENPVSVFSGIFGKPAHTFHPAEYTGYEPSDNYSKLTCLWAGGGVPHAAAAA